MAGGSWVASSPVTAWLRANTISTSPTAMARLATSSLRSTRRTRWRQVGATLDASSTRAGTSVVHAAQCCRDRALPPSGEVGDSVVGVVGRRRDHGPGAPRETDDDHERRPASRATTGTRRGLAGRVLGGRYRVVRMVSAGANTLIADAEDTELSRQVTVKLVRPERAESDTFRERFAADMRTMSTLSHPNIAAVFDWGEEQVGKRTTVYAVVEHLAGGSLRDLFDRSRYLDPSQALVVGLEACRALDFAHRNGLVHTELTPSKLVFGDDRRLRIVDFGLARLLGEHQWAESATVATHVARYASPEQAQGHPIDGKSDVYSLALILVEAVTGAVPFAARSTVATLSARVGKLMPVSADLGALASVLERAGRPEPADRSSAAELGRSLVKAAEKLPRPAPIPIVAASAFGDDPNRLRRPNDPTGGLARPADETPSGVPLLIVPASEPEAPAAAEPAPTASAEGVVDPDITAPVLYDGDSDRTIDELAVLARTAEPAGGGAPSAAVVPVPVAAADQPAQRRRRRWPYVARRGRVARCRRRARLPRLHAVPGGDPSGPRAHRPERVGDRAADGRLRVGGRHPARAQRRVPRARHDHSHRARGGRAARGGWPVPRRRQRRARAARPAGRHRPPAHRRRDGAGPAAAAGPATDAAA